MKITLQQFSLFVVIPVAAALFASSIFAADSRDLIPVAAAVKPSPTIPAGKVETQDLVLRVEKERDDAKAQVAQLTQQNQQQQIVAEYYKAVAEKNDAVLRIVGIQQELQAVKAELATAQAELAALKKVPEAKK